MYLPKGLGTGFVSLEKLKGANKQIYHKGVYTLQGQKCAIFIHRTAHFESLKVNMGKIISYEEAFTWH